MDEMNVFQIAENYERYGMYVEVNDGKPSRTGIDKPEDTGK